MIKQSCSYAIEEVSSIDSPHLAGMNDWLLEIFPEYAPPRFRTLLTRLRHQDGRHEIQIFIGRLGKQVAGLVQMFYREWQNGLIADIDLLGVLEAYRCSGLGLALVKHTVQITSEMASRYKLPAIGIVSLIDPEYMPVVRLHQKLGSQIRMDYQYPSGDVIIWYPFLESFVDVETKVLAEQLQQFGCLLER